MWPSSSPKAPWSSLDIQRIVPFSGHSGARVELLIGSGKSRVRKRAATGVTGARLIAQALKQASAGNAGLPCPAVLAWGETEGLPFFEMDYVQGHSLAARVVEGRRFDIQKLLPLLEALHRQGPGSKARPIPPEAFQRKIADMWRKTGETAARIGYAGFCDDVFVSLLAMDYSGLQAGWGHGDLTLENILERPDGTCVLIDFDVPEISGPVLDLGKLYQDLLGHWCVRKLHLVPQEGPDLANAQVKLDGIRKDLDAALSRRRGIDLPQLHALAAFHLARTLPYMRDAVLMDFVLDRLRWLFGALRAAAGSEPELRLRAAG